jgi:hypothetical protein
MTHQLKVSVFVFCYIVNPFDCSLDLVSFILIEMRASQPAYELVNLSDLHLLGLTVARHPIRASHFAFSRFFTQQAKQDDTLLRHSDITSYGIRGDLPFFMGPFFALSSQEPANIYHQQTETKARHSLAF